MGRKNKERKASSSEEESASSREDGSSLSEREVKEESARSPKRRRKQSTEKNREVHHDRNVERSRWESPDSRKRKHSPGIQNLQKRRGHRDRQEGATKWDKNERDRDIDRDIEKRRKEDSSRTKNERREPPDRDSYRENNRNHERPPQRNDNRENRTNQDRFEGRKSPRRDERNKKFEDRNKLNRNNNDRGRREGRANRFENSEGRNRFDGSRVKREPSPEWGKAQVKGEGDGKPVEKEKPNFELSGKLTEDANMVNGVVIKYTEPLDSRKPKRRWRLYPFKGEKALPTLYVHRQSAYLMGRDRKVADIPLDHPSCSKQHAALQFRLVSFDREDGGEGKRVRPYLIDLESANGTFVNDVKLEPRRYHELLERDVLKFGFSSREYVLLHEQSKDDALDDDVPFTAVAQVKN